MSQREDKMVEIVGTSRTVVRSLIMTRQKLEQDFIEKRQEIDTALQQVMDSAIKGAGHPKGLNWSLQFDGDRVFLVHAEVPTEKGE